MFYWCVIIISNYQSSVKWGGGWEGEEDDCTGAGEIISNCNFLQIFFTISMLFSQKYNEIFKHLFIRLYAVLVRRENCVVENVFVLSGFRCFHGIFIFLLGRFENERETKTDTGT